MKKIICFSFVSMFLLAGTCLALPVAPSEWMGIRTTEGDFGGIVAQDGWSGEMETETQINSGFEIFWDISPDGLEYTYSYSISGEGGTVLSKALSHWILEVTDPSELNDFESVSPSISEGPRTFEPGSGNPDMPGNIYGIKWDTTGDPLTYDVTFTTERDPVWGDFYAKDGTEAGTGIWAVAWNTGFGTTPTEETILGFIPTPNGGEVEPPEPPASVPEPATMFLLGSGLIGLVGLRRKFKK